MNNQWSDNLRKRMEAHEEPAPEGLWKDIEQAIISKSALKTLSKRKHLFLWTKRIGAVAAIVVFCLIGYLRIVKTTKEISQPTKSLANKQVISKGDTAAPPQRQDNNTILAENINASDRKYNKRKPKESENTDCGKETKIQVEKSIEDKEFVTTKKVSDKDQKKYHPTKSQNTSNLSLGSEINVKKEGDRRWETSIYASNISTGSTNNYSGYGKLASMEKCPEIQEPPSPGQNILEDIFVKNESQEVYTDIKHKQPVTIGVSVNYHLNEKWSLASGLSYTMLSSDLKSGSNSDYYYSKQTLHYIGIPLNINYNIWKNKKISFYASGGGVVEKNISGKLTTNYVLDNTIESNGDENISIDELQWSINGSMGFQYNLSNKIGIYAEPGMSYYFNNQNKIETLYKEKPFNFKLQFGLRFSLGE